MTFRRPPLPGKDLGAWARQMYEYMSSQSPIQGSVDPTPLLLAHLTDGQVARAATDGVLLFDPVAGEVVVSIGGVFETLGPYTLSLPDIIAAGSAGDADSIPQITVDAKGRVTALSQIDVSIAAAKINDSTAAGRAMLLAADVAAQTALLDVFTTALKGLVPASNNNPRDLLYSDGVWRTGSKVLLAAKTASSSASLDFTEFNNSVYKAYEFELEDVKPANDGVDITVRLSTNGGSSNDAGASDYGWSCIGLAGAGTPSGGGTNTASSIPMTFTNAMGNAATERGATGKVTLYNAPNAKHSRIINHITTDSTTSLHLIFIGGGRRTADQDTDALRFIMSAGNIASGTIRMYGLT